MLKDSVNESRCEEKSEVLVLEIRTGVIWLLTQPFCFHFCL